MKLLIGQNNKTILDNFDNGFDGFMSYIPLSSLDGLKNTTNFGNGDTNISELLTINPQIINIGLDLDHGNDNFYDKLLNGSYDSNIEEFKTFFSKYSIEVFVRIGYELHGKIDYNKFNTMFDYIAEKIKTDSIYSCLDMTGNLDLRDRKPLPKLFDYVGFSCFTNNDYGILAKNISKLTNKPLLIGESCSAKNNFDNYIEFLKKIIKNNSIHSISYISQNWKEYSLWKNDKFWNKTNSKLNKDKTKKLLSLKHL